MSPVFLDVKTLRQEVTAISPRTPEQTATSKVILGSDKNRVDRLLAGSIIFLLILLFGLGALIIKRVYLQTPLVRTALERELVIYQKSLEKDPNDLNTRVAIAQVFARMGKTSAAVGELKKVLDFDPKHWDALFQLGLVYLDNDKKTRAIDQFKKAAKAKPDDELAYYQLGLIAYEDKEFKDAVTYLDKAVKISPILADAHYYLARSYERTGDKGSAKRHYEEALRFIPDYAEAKDGLARVRN